MTIKDFEYHTINCNNSTIHLLYFEPFNPADYLDRLTALELERYHQFSHIKRKREFVATRILRHQLFGFEHIHYDINGAPYIDQEGYISVSHSNQLVGIAVNPKYQVGFDLEAPRDRIIDVKHKFLSEEEKEVFDCNDIKTLTQIWSSKETLYKLAGRKEIIFKTQLLLSKDAFDNWKGRIINPTETRCVKLNIFEWKGIVITINADKIEFE